MASAKAYGSITITDVTDVGRLSVYITSNQPQTVIENPNDGTYTPDWRKQNLVLTPVIYFNETQLTLPKTGLTVTWKRKEGSLDPVDLKASETVKNGILTVSNNELASIQSGLLTYIANIQYTETNTNITLETQAQMSFSLSRQGTEAKYCSITGESVFLYDTNQSLVSKDTIELTASLTNVSVAQWQYKGADGNFVAMPTTNNPSITGTKLTVKATENVLFNSDVAVIKLATNDSSVYDLHTITKIRDGAAGNSTVAIVLSNESHTLPCDSHGVIDKNAYAGAETTVGIFEGGVDVTSKWTISAIPSNGIQGTFENNTYKVTHMDDNVDVGHVEFSCVSKASTLKKRFTLIKQKAGVDGADATIWSVNASTLSLNLSKGVFTPANVTFSAVKQVGAGAQTVYNGRFKIYESVDGLNFGTAKYESSTDEPSKLWAPTNTSIRAIKCEMYGSGATTDLKDTQTVIITKDGQDGQDGNDGSGGISFGIGNEAEVIPCNPDGTVKVQKVITIPFFAYKGIQRVAVTCDPNSISVPEGVTKTVKNGSSSADGLITLTFPAGNALGTKSDLSGNISFNLVAEGVTVTKKFSWTKSIQSTNAVLLQIFAPQGDVIINGQGNVILDTQLTDGSAIVNSGVTYKWAKFQGDGGYQDIPGQAGKSLTVTPGMVETLASFRCRAHYAGKDFDAYWSVTDRNDPVTVNVLCSVGTQLTNETTFGVVYTLAYLNGKEVDPIKSTTFSIEAPKSAQDGDFYYHIDKKAKTVTLKKYNGSAWEDAAGDDLPKATYKYFRRQNGVELDKSEAWKEGKAVYVDREIVDNSLMILCEMSNIPMF